MFNMLKKGMKIEAPNPNNEEKYEVGFVHELSPDLIHVMVLFPNGQVTVATCEELREHHEDESS